MSRLGKQKNSAFTRPAFADEIWDANILSLYTLQPSAEKDHLCLKESNHRVLYLHLQHESCTWCRVLYLKFRSTYTHLCQVLAVQFYRHISTFQCSKIICTWCPCTPSWGCSFPWSGKTALLYSRSDKPLHGQSKGLTKAANSTKCPRIKRVSPKQGCWTCASWQKASLQKWTGSSHQLKVHGVAVFYQLVERCYNIAAVLSLQDPAPLVMRSKRWECPKWLLASESWACCRLQGCHSIKDCAKSARFPARNEHGACKAHRSNKVDVKRKAGVILDLQMSHHLWNFSTFVMKSMNLMVWYSFAPILNIVKTFNCF